MSDTNPKHSGVYAQSTGVHIDNEQGQVTFEFEPDDYDRLVEHGLKPSMWLGVDLTPEQTQALDTSSNYEEFLDSIWAILYPDNPKSWEYPGQVFRHIRAHLSLPRVSSNNPRIVCLCGSTRFSEAYQTANYVETLAGNIVLTIGCDMKSDEGLFKHYTPAQLQDVKERLDTLHLRKIDLADEVFILNVDGYVGESTKREIAYSLERGKTVRYLTPDIRLTIPVIEV